VISRIPRHYWIIGSLTLSALTAITFLLFRSYLEAESLLRDQFAGQQMLTIRQTARGIERSLGQLIREAEILSRMPAIRELDLVESRKLMGQAFEEVKPFHVNDISRSDADGVIRLTLNSPNLLGQDFSFREYFKEVRRRKDSVPAFEFLTFRGFRKGEKGILVSMPVFGEKGEFAGPVNFVVEVGNLLREFLPPEGGGRRTWVLDEDGTVLYHPKYGPGTSLADLSEPGSPFRNFLKRSTATESVRANYLSSDGSRVIATSHPIELGGRNWTIIAETDEVVIRDLLGNFNSWYLIGMLMAALAVFFGGLALAVMVDRNKASLQHEIDEREKGEDAFRYREETYQAIVDNSPS
jgi:hypothetical protein